ncbi:hypothetical protein ALQ24_200079 [Pseudomonas syringae pv. antirrhini]|uniref:hypothetical protein n=1 Tax=Pseudomonas TaxID=286 RepID=UPI000EFE94D4|nr:MULTISPECIES: hypothetical protein [Pseudomonas]RMP38507.1 hypothetical protein ALQ24_200079 [Pseudomonas syringae pv. antirrhini]WIN10152.1 hypothetical protein QQF68_27940 [Pseudomonas syringae pv. antirrhini str. 126]
MAGKDPTTQREALAVQMLEEIDGLVSKLDQVSSDMRTEIEQAIRDAAGKALLQTQMNFESVLERGQLELLQAAKTATARIGNELNRGGLALLLSTKQLKQRLVQFLIIGVLTAVAAGVGGGYLGARWAMGL